MTNTFVRGSRWASFPKAMAAWAVTGSSFPQGRYQSRRKRFHNDKSEMDQAVGRGADRRIRNDASNRNGRATFSWIETRTGIGNMGGGAGSSRSTILRKRIRCCTGNLQGNPSFTALSAWTTASHSECDAPFLQWNSLGFKTGISDCDAGIECLSAVQPGYKIRPKLPRPRFCILPALSGSASTLQIR